MSLFQLFLWALALVSLSSAKADPSLQMEVTPAWNGYYRSGKPTEIGVKLISPHSTVVNISGGHLFQTVELEAGIPKSIGLPLLPDNFVAVLIHAASQDNPGSAIEKSVALTASKIPNIALVTEGLTLQDRQSITRQLHQIDNDNLFFISALTLPRFISGYESVDMIIIPYQGLKNLDDQQIKTLSLYLGNCGKTIALEFPPAIYSKLRKIAGCNGNFLVTASYPFAFSEHIKNLIHQNPESLPELSALADALPVKGIYTSYTLLVGFCLGYLLIVIMTTWIAKQKYIFFIAPLLATVIVILIGCRQQPERNLISWVQMDSQHRSARYSALLTLRGNGKWREISKLPTAAMMSGSALTSLQALQFNGEQPEVISTNTEYPLLSYAQWYWQSSLDMEAPLQLQLVNQQPVVTNMSQQNLKAGLLKWQGENYPLPALQPGQTWTPTASVTGNMDLISMMSKYSKHFTTAVLIPFTPELLTFAENQSGWLLIYLDESRILP